MKTALTIIAMVLLISCKKSDEEIPNVHFNATISLNDPKFNKNPIYLQTDNSGNTIGTNGVILFKSAPNEYHVFDAMCTHERQSTCLATITDAASATCKCCGSIFVIAIKDGGVAKGPAKAPLKVYYNKISGSYLQIWN